MVWFQANVEPVFAQFAPHSVAKMLLTQHLKTKTQMFSFHNDSLKYVLFFVFLKKGKCDQ